jgi:hypothetical protein
MDKARVQDKELLKNGEDWSISYRTDDSQLLECFKTKGGIFGMAGRLG